MDLVIAGIMIVLITACGQAAQDTPPTEATQTQVPITSTTLPSTSTPAPTNTSIPPTRTPFPASCTPADSTILEVIRAFEVLANEKNLEGTMELLAENAIIEESFRGVFKEGTAEIEAFWRVYYWGSPPAEFRDIMICGNMATFVWVELHALRALFWPVVIEIHNGKITYLDFYEDSTIGSLGDE
jgi:hypothetical protein